MLCLVCISAHRGSYFLFDRSTRISKCVAKLDSTYRWCLTGTPVTNSLYVSCSFVYRPQSTKLIFPRADLYGYMRCAIELHVKYLRRQGLISCIRLSGSVVSSPGMAGNFLMIESYVTSTIPVASVENTRLYRLRYRRKGQT